MIAIGLTGSIGMGKSTTATMFATAGVPVFDADRAVHRLYAGRAAPVIEKAFPGVVADGVVDRQRLSKQVVGDSDALKRLEGIIHPLVQEERDAFVGRAQSAGSQAIVFDIPLLFETGGEKKVDLVVVVTTSADIQRARVLKRPDMTAEKLDALLAKQVPDAEKRRRAHFLIDTSYDFAFAERQVRGILRAIAAIMGTS